jgi:hypothetical protein
VLSVQVAELRVQTERSTPRVGRATRVFWLSVRAPTNRNACGRVKDLGTARTRSAARRGGGTNATLHRGRLEADSIAPAADPEVPGLEELREARLDTELTEAGAARARAFRLAWDARQATISNTFPALTQ